MKQTTRKKVIELVKDFLQEKPEGASYSEIINYLKSKLVDVPENTLNGSMHNLRTKILNGEEKEIDIKERGFYILAHNNPITATAKEVKKIKEEDFYNVFAKYLIEGLKECTNATALGRSAFQDKWGTPDVIGVYKFSEADPIKPPLEILSAEIKTDASQLITAFGQACAYKIFSHKVYLVVPQQATDDIKRLEPLCLKFGIGLVLFDNKDPKNPNFQIRARAVKTEPDYIYVNHYIQKLNKDLIKKLLG